MEKPDILSGVVHTVPPDIAEQFTVNEDVLRSWNALTPLARNEWICWVESVKQEKTRKAHIERLLNELREGKKRPCCWPGCPHREKDTLIENKPTVDQFIESKVLPRYVPIIENFRRLVSGEFPVLREEMRGGTEKYYGVPVYRHKHIVITVSPTRKGVTFSFSDGRLFEDKYALLEGEGNRTLNLRIGDASEYSDEVMRYYIRQAIDIDSQ